MTEFKYLNSLKPLPFWVLWRLERDRNDRLIKIPYSALYNGHASSTNPKTWATFNQAVRVHKSTPDYYRGLGIIISEESDLVFIDIDHSVNPDGQLSKIASDIVSRFSSSYVEISQSGTGIHIITRGKIPRSFKNSNNGVEMYSSARFCALTGNALNGSEPSLEQSALDYVYKHYKKPERVPQRRTQPSGGSQNSDDWIIEHASQRGRFSDLYSGDWSSAGYKSQSEADVALCLILAFWTNCDPDQMDRLFCSSGLYRSKWDRQDYRDRTISTAISQCRETLPEFIKRKNEERGDRIVRMLSKAWDH